MVIRVYFHILNGVPKTNKMSKEHYRPLPSSLTIKDSSLSSKTGRRELGVFATQDISEGVCLGVTHYYLDFESVPDMSGGSHKIVRTPLGGFINHNETPNCRLLQDITVTPVEWQLHTLNDIKEGEEILLTYTQYNPKD